MYICIHASLSLSIYIYIYVEIQMYIGRSTIMQRNTMVVAIVDSEDLSDAASSTPGRSPRLASGGAGRSRFGVDDASESEEETYSLGEDDIHVHICV